MATLPVLLIGLSTSSHWAAAHHPKMRSYAQTGMEPCVNFRPHSIVLPLDLTIRQSKFTKYTQGGSIGHSKGGHCVRVNLIP